MNFSVVLPQKTKFDTDGILLDSGAVVHFSVSDYKSENQDKLVSEIKFCCERLNQIESVQAE